MAASTVSVDTTAYRAAKAFPVGRIGAGLQAWESAAVAVATTSLDDVGDVVELFVVPAGIKIWSVYIVATQMDTHETATLAWTLKCGDTSLITGLTLGQTATSGIYNLATLHTTTADQVVSATVTATAATAQAGTLKLRLFYTTT